MMHPPDGDLIVGLLGVVMALALVSRHAAVQRIDARTRWVYGALWAVIIGVVAAVAARWGAH